MQERTTSTHTVRTVSIMQFLRVDSRTDGRMSRLSRADGAFWRLPVMRQDTCEVCLLWRGAGPIPCWHSPFALQHVLTSRPGSHSLGQLTSHHWPSFGKGENKGCDIVGLIVLFWCFWCVKDYKVESVYWNIVWWGCESISINRLFFSPFDETRSVDVNWPR